VLAAMILHHSYGIDAEDAKTPWAQFASGACKDCTSSFTIPGDAASYSTSAMLQRHGGITGEVSTKVNTVVDEDIDANPKLVNGDALQQACVNVGGTYAASHGLADAMQQGPWIIEQRGCNLVATLEGAGGQQVCQGEVRGTEIFVHSPSGRALQGHVMPGKGALTFPALGPGPILVKQDKIASVLQTRSSKKNRIQPDTEAAFLEDVLRRKGFSIAPPMRVWARSNWTD